MMGAVLLAAALAFADSVPRLTLAEALERATRLDPNYVRALGQISTAEWARRSAKIVFVLPSVSVSTDYSTFSIPQFNLGTGSPAKTIVTARADARLELFTGGRKLADLAFTGAQLETAEATEVQARFLAALATEANYYAVLGGQELRDVARDRLSRAENQLVVARARVVSGAVVQTDSLQILLEVNRAHVGLLQEEARLTVARLQLGRRVGVVGPVEAVPVDTLPPGELPFTLSQAIQLALEQGPDYRIARGNERAAGAIVRSRTSAYFPQAVLSANTSAFGDQFFPNGLNRSSVTLSVSVPLWNGFQRELEVSRARVFRDLARAVREDLERAAEGDVTQAYEAYQTARATQSYSAQGVIVARETYRVQEARYRAGASTILDLLDAQTALTEAQADLVQARYATRLSLAGLEAILGRRMSETKDAK